MRRDSIAAMPPPTPEPVKSARRVLQVFELFDKLRRPLGVTQVAGHLGYPISSTAVLLRSLVELGYMRQDPVRRDYFPTARISLLGDWVASSTLGHDGLHALLRRVQAETGEVAILAARQRLDVQYIAMLEPDSGDMTYMPGTRRPLFHSAAGLAILSTYADEAIGQLLRHHNALQADPAARLRPAEVLEEVAATRARGHALLCDRIRPGRGSVAMLLPLDPAQDSPIALSISADTPVLRAREAEIRAVMRAAIAAQRP
jgi:DNA-binding IclR family transcriptional regulator